MFEVFIKIFISFLVIIDPLASAVYFLGISKKFTNQEKIGAINFATLIAGVTLVFFLITGPFLLSILGIDISSFQIAGGLVLLLISIKFALGTFLTKEEVVNKQTSIMIIGVPLITGPGVLTTTIIMVGEYGHLVTFVAAMAALAVTWVILKFGDVIYKFVGEKWMEIVSRLMGLLLAAIAVEFITKGVMSVLNVR